MAEKSKAVSLMIKEDGCYLQINKLSGATVARMDVMRIVEENKIKDIDFKAIGEIFKIEDSVFEIKISSNVNVLVVAETARIHILSDQLTATVTFFPPINSDEIMSIERFRAVLADNNVHYGTDEIRLLEVYQNREYGVAYTIAKGTLPVDGINGYLKYHFDTEPKNYRPRERGDGTVDYKQVDLFDVVKENDLLIEGVPPIEGEDGTGVTGKPIAHKPGKQHPPIMKTKNTVLTDDGHMLYAGCAGQLVFSNNRVEIFPVLQISGDVNHSTGNIDFVGSVIIAGDIKTGFSVKAEGNIEVYGIAEGALLDAGEDIKLVGGVKGIGQSRISAKGNISAKYLDQCEVSADGNIYTDYIVYSTIKCSGKVELFGKRGLLLGGKATVKEAIYARTIGANMSASTELELGFTPDDLARYKTLLADLDEARTEYDKIDKYDQMLAHRAARGTAQNDSAYQQASFSKSYYKDMIEELQQEIDMLISDFSGGETCVMVGKVIYSGVRITIGSANTTIIDDTPPCVIRNTNGKINIELTQGETNGDTTG